MITSRDNETVKLAVKLMTSAKDRKKNRCFVAEGVRLCRDAAESGAKIKQFLYTAAAAEKYRKDFEKLISVSVSSAELSGGIFDRISDTSTPQGFLCIISMDEEKDRFDVVKGRKYAALENVQDPSNMGTILRTAEAFGADGVLLSSGCCDVYSPKVVRGSMGAVFRLPVMTVSDFSDAIGKYTDSGINTYASTPREAVGIEDVSFADGGIMLIGNEGNGLDEETISRCSQRVMIRMKGRAESLNASAAAAVLLYEMMK